MTSVGVCALSTTHLMLHPRKCPRILCERARIHSTWEKTAHGGEVRLLLICRQTQGQGGGVIRLTPVWVCGGVLRCQEANAAC